MDQTTVKWLSWDAARAALRAVAVQQRGLTMALPWLARGTVYIETCDVYS